MPARVVATLILAVAAIAAAWRPAEARTEFIFTERGWTGAAAYEDESGDFDRCSVFRKYGAITVMISLSRDGDLALGFSSGDWRLGHRERYPLRLQIDGATSRSATGFGDGEVLALSLSQDWDFFQALRKGHRLSVRGEARPLIFDLTGTSAALQKTLQCFLARSSYASRLTNPFLSPHTENPFGTPSAPESRVLPEFGLTADQLEALKLLVFSAGFEDFTFETREEFSTWGRLVVAGWRNPPGDMRGKMLILPKADPRATMAAYVTSISVACDERFAILQDGYEVWNGKSIGRAEALCQTESYTFYIDMILTFGPDLTVGFLHMAHSPLREKASAVNERLMRIWAAL